MAARYRPVPAPERSASETRVVSRLVLGLDRRQVVAQRVAAHHLDRRRGRDDWRPVAGVAGVRRTKQTAASFAARLEDASGARLAAAVEDRTLVATFGPRGAVHLVPPDDFEVFTLGALPSDEPSLGGAIKPFMGALRAAGMAATDALQRVVDAAVEVLNEAGGGPMPKAELAHAVTARVPAVLRPPCRGRCPDPHVEDLLFRLAGMAGAFCFAGASEDLVLTEKAIGRAPDHRDAAARTAARAEVVRRYVRAFGPGTANGFAGWLNVPPADARQSFGALAHELVDVAVDGDKKSGVVLAADADRFTERGGAVAGAAGVRFLPAYDPFLESRERASLLPDREQQKRVWKSSGVPGALLLDGELVATWRTKTARTRVDVVVEPLGPALPGEDELVAEAAVTVAALDGDGTRQVQVKATG